MKIHKDIQVGALATEHPLATRVLARHGIDFCCGGGKPLEEACSASGVEVDALIAELELELAGATEPEVRWDEAPLQDLVEHILRRYHDRLKEELPRLAQMARKVHEVHGDKDPEGLGGVLRTFLAIQADIDQHLMKEEQILFPAILAGRRHQLGGPITVMEEEHETLGELLRTLRGFAHDYVVPAEACTTWRALWAGLEELERDLHEHIHLENNVLHKRAFNG